MDHEASKLAKKWRGQCYFSNFSTYARGVMIWIAPGTPFRLIYQEADVEGRHILLQGQLNGQNIAILNTYGPNADDPQYYPRIQQLIGSEIEYPLIWLGDFNCILDGVQDRHPPRLGTKPRMTTALKLLMQNLGLVDIWRYTHPTQSEYSCYAPPMAHIAV